MPLMYNSTHLHITEVCQAWIPESKELQCFSQVERYLDVKVEDSHPRLFGGFHRFVLMARGLHSLPRRPFSVAGYIFLRNSNDEIVDIYELEPCIGPFAHYDVLLLSWVGEGGQSREEPLLLEHDPRKTWL